MLRSCDVGKIWDLWWDGDRHNRYAPYRNLHRNFDLGHAAESDGDRTNFSKAWKVITTVLSLAQVEPAAVVAISRAARDTCFHAAYFEMFRRFYPGLLDEDLDKKNIGNRQYVIVYDLIRKCDVL